MVRLALKGEFVPYAVNVSAGAEVAEVARPFLPLCDKLGRILTGMAQGAVRSLECQYLGRIAEADTRVLTLAVVKGVLAGIVHEPVSFVNAPMIARGAAQISEMRSSVSTDYRTSSHHAGRYRPVSVAGTLSVEERRARDQVNGDIEMAPALTLLHHETTRRVGHAMTSAHEINIARWTSASGGHERPMGFSDSLRDTEIIDELARDGAESACFSLPSQPSPKPDHRVRPATPFGREAIR
jgi:D-3-phosphoglycerate dehydrogenase